MNEINSQTRTCAVIGWPVDHSLSPPMQNAAIQALGLNWVYLAFAVRPEQLAHAVQAVRALDLVGANCTIPHKETVLPYLDEISDLARAIGAVNTIHNVNGTIVGHNTDAYGFTQSVIAEGELLIGGITVLILGGGGVARGMAAGAAMEGARKIIIANRTRERSERIVEEIGPFYPNTSWEVVQASPPSLKNAAGRSNLIVNATSLGMRENDPLPIEADLIDPGHVVFDSVYTPPDTPLLRAARSRGAIAVGGLGMLARQGAKALSIWSGLQPDEDLMLSVLQKHFRR